MPFGSLAAAASAIVAGAAYVAPGLGLVSVTVGDPLEAPLLKNSPLTTALGPAVLVTCSVTCPVTVQLQYWPPVNPLTVRVSSTAFVTASRTCSVSARLVVSQSTTYTASWCGAPSVTFTSIANVPPYHAAASRPPALAFCSARTSVVDAAHV